jgi:hypothetical protein
MPVQSRGFVPGGVVQNEQLTKSFLFPNSFGHFIQEELEDFGVHAIHNEAEEASALGSDKADDVLAEVIAQIRHGARLARLPPAAARARIVRGQVLSLKTRPFVEASRALGAGPLRILARHIIPNAFSVVIVYVTLTVPAIILYESFLSFLGLGIQPPMASWGSLIAEGVDQINSIRVYWWLIVFPGGVLVSTLLAFNYLGDGLRDAWDVRGGT